MSSEDSVTQWISELRDESPEAADRIWRHFVNRLLAVARRKIPSANRVGYDEEDAAQSAFHSLCAGLMQGRFEDVLDRNSLWSLLLVITSRKIAVRRRYDSRQRRDAARSVQESVFSAGGADLGLDGMPSREPSPEFAFEFAETCDELFAGLDADKLRQVGLLKMDGYSDSEVAEKLNCSRRTIQRRLELIRRNWISVSGFTCTNEYITSGRITL